VVKPLGWVRIPAQTLAQSCRSVVIGSPVPTIALELLGEDLSRPPEMGRHRAAGAPSRFFRVRSTFVCTAIPRDRAWGELWVSNIPRTMTVA